MTFPGIDRSLFQGKVTFNPISHGVFFPCFSYISYFKCFDDETWQVDRGTINEQNGGTFVLHTSAFFADVSIFPMTSAKIDKIRTSTKTAVKIEPLIRNSWLTHQMKFEGPNLHSMHWNKKLSKMADKCDDVIIFWKFDDVTITKNWNISLQECAIALKFCMLKALGMFYSKK